MRKLKKEFGKDFFFISSFFFFLHVFFLDCGHRFFPHWCWLYPWESLYLRRTPKLINQHCGPGLTKSIHLWAAWVSDPMPGVPNNSLIQVLSGPFLLNFEWDLGLPTLRGCWLLMSQMAKQKLPGCILTCIRNILLGLNGVTLILTCPTTVMRFLMRILFCNLKFTFRRF